MKNRMFQYGLLVIGLLLRYVAANGQTAQNPIIFADVPDMAMTRVGNMYYMSSTTMHLSPGLPIMKSKDLVNWQLVALHHSAFHGLPVWPVQLR